MPEPTEFCVRAPTRLDFGGGWTDVAPYDVEQGGYVCNIAISRYATVRVRRTGTESPADAVVTRTADARLLEAALRKFDVRGARFTLTSDFPVAAGLGGSSAAGVATIAAIQRVRGENRSRAEIAEASREVETVELRIAGGRQDHYAAAFGGALGLRFGNRVTATPIALSAATAAELSRRFLVIYTGESRISGNTITAVLDAYRQPTSPVRTTLARMRALAEQMAVALGGADLDALGSLIGEHWVLQRSLDPAIPTPLIDRIVSAATTAGAIGCKALGASGGGCVLVVAPRDGVDRVRQAIAPLGELVSYEVDTSGVAPCA